LSILAASSLITGLFLGLAVGVIIGVPLAWLEVKRQTRRARAAERRARASERLAEIGGMTGGLAHEIKNPLSTIGLNAQLLGESISELPIEPAEKNRLVRRIDILRREVERLRDILSDFLRFAGTVHIDAKPADLNAVVEELIDFYHPQAHHHQVRIRADLAPGPLRAMIDVPHFKQALLNLMINATQAMEHSSGAPRELILRTTPARGHDAPLVQVHVIDTGPGIPPDNLDKIFTPYFTTKSGGSGLGLPTARRLIEEHHGHLEVHSDPGHGTDFVISLPRID
jgi:signal transduction histidine kinase